MLVQGVSRKVDSKVNTI